MSTIIYCRISKDHRGDEAGVEQQERECRAFCEEKGWTVDRVMVDNGFSATTGKRRPAFEELLLLDDVTRVVVYHTDRLTRVGADLERVIERAWPVFALHAGHLDLTSHSGKAVARTLCAWATYEGDIKSARIKSAHDYRVAAGRPWWGGHRPFGYNSDGSINKDEWPHLRAAYDLALEGKGTAEITRHLNNVGARRVRTGRPNWTIAGVRELLLAPRNAGLLIHRDSGVIGMGNWTPVVTREEFDMACLLLTDTPHLGRQENRTHSLLGGILSCGKCGGRAYRDSTAAMGLRYVTKCRHASAPLEQVDKAVTKTVLALMASPEAHVRWATHSGEDARDIAKELTEVRERLEGLTDDYVNGALSKEMLARAATKLQAREEELNRELRRWIKPSPLGEYGRLADLIVRWNEDDLPLAARRGIVAEWIERVELLPRPRGYRKGWDPEQHLRITPRDFR